MPRKSPNLLPGHCADHAPVVGQLAFGYTSDAYSRKWSLLVSTILLIVFAALAAGSWGKAVVLRLTWNMLNFGYQVTRSRKESSQLS